MRSWRNIKDFFLSFRYPNGKYFLISFPKTGRTWLMYMIHQIQDEMKTDVSIQDTHDLSEIIIENGFRQDPYLIFKFPDRIRYRRSKVIFLVRDPRDVVVSHYHQVTKRSINPFVFSSISEFVQNELFGFKRIIHFYNLWYRSSEVPVDFLLVKYEDLVNNGENELYRIFGYLGLDINKKIISSVYCNSSASKMRRDEINNKLENFRDFGKEMNQLKVRNAKIGGYKDELSEEDINYCNAEMENLDTYFNYHL